MFRKSYRMLTFVLVFAVMFGLFAAMAPAEAQAAGMGGGPRYGKTMKMDTGSARFEPNELPNPFVRDFEGKCEWWQYELRGGSYVRTYCPCKYGDVEVDYSINHRQIFAEYMAGDAQ